MSKYLQLSRGLILKSSKIILAPEDQDNGKADCSLVRQIHWAAMQVYLEDG